MLEGGGEVEHGPGQDDVVVGAQKEGDHHGAHPRPPQDGAQPVQGACRDIWLSSDPSYQYTHLSDNVQRRQSSRSNVKIQEIAYQLLRQYTISRSDSEQQVSLKIVELSPYLF